MSTTSNPFISDERPFTDEELAILYRVLQRYHKSIQAIVEALALTGVVETDDYTLEIISYEEKLSSSLMQLLEQAVDTPGDLDLTPFITAHMNAKREQLLNV